MAYFNVSKLFGAAPAVALGLGAVWLGGCGSETLDPGNMRFSIGQEEDPFLRDPAPTSIEIVKQLATGERTTVATLGSKGRGFDMPFGDAGFFEALARDDSGTVQVRGRSLVLDPRGFAETTVSLFVARTNEFSRPFGNLVTDVGEAPKVAVYKGRYLLTASELASGGLQTDAYDLGFWAATTGGPAIPCPHVPCGAKSLAIVNTWYVMSIGDDWASSYDMYDGSSSIVTLPAGLANYGEISGGAAVYTGDGSVYIVGATRSGSETSKVLLVAADGTMKALSLLSARAGASAIWLPGQGLLVTGGSATAAGAELLAPAATAFNAIAYPPDPTVGAGLADLGGGKVRRSGGRNPDGSAAPTVELILACGTACTPAVKSGTIDLVSAQSFAIGDGQVLSVGPNAAGETVAFMSDGAQVTPAPFREPRRGAAVTLVPTGQVAVVGGTRIADNTPAHSVELFTSR